MIKPISVLKLAKWLRAMKVDVRDCKIFMRIDIEEGRLFLTKAEIRS